MNTTVIQQIEDQSSKTLFLYNLHSHKFEHLSQAAARLLGPLHHTLLDSPQQLLAYIHSDDRNATAARVAKLKQGIATEIKFTLLLPEQPEKEIKADAYPITDENGKVYAIAGFAEDISEQMQYQNYLIEFANRKDSLLEIIAHDLRGPLATVKTVTGLLEEEHQEKNYEEVSNYTKIIQDAYNECITLITELLKEEHHQSPNISVNKERTNVVDIVKKVVKPYQLADRIALAFEVESRQDKIVAELDLMKFMQIMNNLVANSIKFTKPGGKVTISIDYDNKNLLIRHRDTGIGIPADQQPYIFVRRNQASRVGLRGEPTNGVGLSIVRELVEIQGGSIRVESEENKGTTFYLTFPMQQVI